MASSEEAEKVCVACRHMRRKCEPDCVFAPHFGPDDGERFAALDRAFGASFVSQQLADREPRERAAAIEMLVRIAIASVPRPAGVKAQQEAAAAQISREQALIRQYHSGTGFGVPAYQSAEYQAMIASHQEMLMRNAGAVYQPLELEELLQGAAAKQKSTLQPVAELQQQRTAAEEVARHHNMVMRQAAAAQNYQAWGLEQQREGAAAKQKSILQPVAELQQQRTAADVVARYHDMVLRQAAAAVQNYQALGLEQREGAAAKQKSMLQPVAELQQQRTAADEVARYHDMMMRQAAAAAVQNYQALGIEQQREGAAAKQKSMLQPVAELQQQRTAAEEVARHHDKMMQHAAAAQNYQALGLEQQHQNRQLAEGVMHQTELTAEAAKRATAEEAAGVREVDMVLQSLRQAAVEEQYMDNYLRAVMLETVADGQQQQHPLHHDQAGQNAAMLQQKLAQGIVNTQKIDQQIAIAQQHWEKKLTTMQQAAANAPAMRGEQPQPQRQTRNAQFQKESSLPPLPTQPRHAGGASGARTMPFLPGRSADSEAFLVQPSLPSLPPSLADTPRQQQNDGGNEDLSVDPTLRLWNH